MFVLCKTVLGDFLRKSMAMACTIHHRLSNQRGGQSPPLCIPSLAAPLRALRSQDSATCDCDNAADYLSRAKAYDNLNFSHITSSTAFGGPPSPEGKARVREYVCDVCP